VKWDYWYHREKPVEEAFLLNKYLIEAPIPWRVGGAFVRRTLRVNLNKIASTPDEIFHSHPGTAIRIILSGGYREHEWRPDGNHVVHEWRPGMVGIVPPTYRHRIFELLDGPSYSLWLRGVVTDDIWYLVDGVEKTIKVASNARRARTF